MSLSIVPSDSDQLPTDLLLLADPSIDQIHTYLKQGDCYVMKNETEVVGVMVLSRLSTDSSTIEIKNIAIRESWQGKGLGKKLLAFAEEVSKAKGFYKLRIGTGNSSLAQLGLYQKAGFELTEVIKDFFIQNYESPIYENGIICKHMVILEKKIKA